MNIEVLPPRLVNDPLNARLAAEPDSQQDVTASYDGSNVMFRLLRLGSWGPGLMNLGYHKYRGILRFMNIGANLERSQRRLVMKSIELLNVQPQHQVLDLACGRGKSSFILQCLHPRATVVGVDLLDHHVQVARTLFGQVENLTYAVGSAMDLDYPDASFDRIMCLEAAFHFPDRGEFLREAYRVLRPGGRLIVVDFAWNSNADREHVDDPETRLVRDIWQWDDLFSIPEYELRAREAGFEVHSRHDWTRRVTHPIQGMFEHLSALGNTRWGLRILHWKNPLYASLSTADWQSLAQVVRAHSHVQRFSKYMAFVFEKT